MDNIVLGVYDLETTGTDPIKDRICQISIAKINSNFDVIDKKKFLINPGIPIPKEATDVHGITNEMVATAYPFKSYADRMVPYLNECYAIGGYNSNKFDLPMLVEECTRAGYQFPRHDMKHFDGMKIFHTKEPRDLTAALKFYTGKDMVNAHDAESDVLATIDILAGQCFMYGLTIDEAIKLSEFDPNMLDFQGKLKLIDGVPCFNFGEHKGQPVKNHISFANWMLDPRRDFSTQTKNIVLSIINSK